MTAPSPGRRLRAARALALWAALAAAPACASRTPSLPTGGGAPFPDAPAAYGEATSQCRGVSTLSAELALSGHAGGTRLRGRILGGFAAPGKVRLEAPAPFGRPVFILVARDGSATLVLGRDRRVVRDAPPAALVEALAGVPLGADDLRGAVAGCGFGVARVSAGESYAGDWVTAEGDGTRVWLRRVDGAWRLVAGVRGTLEIRYEAFASGRPSVVRLRSSAGSGATDLTIRLSQVDINVPLEDAVFEVEVPDDATPLTLEELRRGGPLGGGTAGGAAAVTSASLPRRSSGS